jgi:dihydropteroate synthase
MIHPLYHTLHPYRQLLIELIILHLLRLLHELPWFVSLGFAILIGRKKIYVDAADAEEPDAVAPGALEPDAMELDTGEPDAVEPDVGPEV